jgi:hypothetical protein
MAASNRVYVTRDLAVLVAIVVVVLNYVSPAQARVFTLVAVGAISTAYAMVRYLFEPFGQIDYHDGHD